MNPSIPLCLCILMSLFAYLFIIISLRPIDVKCVVTLYMSAQHFQNLAPSLAVLILEVHERAVSLHVVEQAWKRCKLRDG